MRLTEKRAIKESKPLWAFLAKTGKLKEDWPEWDEASNESDYYVFDGKEITAGCFLCEYSNRQGKWACDACPYYQEFEYCYNEGASFRLWSIAETKKDRKKYAQEFLDQLNQL